MCIYYSTLIIECLNWLLAPGYSEVYVYILYIIMFRAFRGSTQSMGCATQTMDSPLECAIPLHVEKLSPSVQQR